jgi:CRP-like cAMP-binding protein/Fe-S-cluster-containing hydrogenase component 2
MELPPPRADQHVAGGANIPVVAGFEPPDLSRLKTYPFLARCSDTILKKLQPHLSEQRFRPGDSILRAGSYSDAAYFLASGVVTVRLTPVEQDSGTAALAVPAGPPPSFAARIREILARQPAQQAVQRGGVDADETVFLTDLPSDLRANQDVLIHAGEVFGEASALTRYPIAADVIARTDAQCLVIRAAGLRLMFQQEELADFKKLIDDRYRERTLASHLRGSGLFTSLGDSAIEKLRESAELLSFEPGTLIVEQGSPADAFYLVRGGFVKVAVRVGEAIAPVTYLRKGDYTGEIGLLLDEPWPFSLMALEHVELVKLPRAVFQAVLSDDPDTERQLWEVIVTRLKERGSVERAPLTSRHLQMAMDTGLIHGESVLLIDLSTCTRCDDCVLACADTHGGTPRLVRDGNKYRNFSVPHACYQCTDPVCMIGCPTGAIARPLGTLEVTINKDTCIGCRNCVTRCPWDNIIEVPFHSPTLNREINLATKCDLCVGRKEGPACVQMCPHGSAVRISFKDLATVSATFSD